MTINTSIFAASVSALTTLLVIGLMDDGSDPANNVRNELNNVKSNHVSFLNSEFAHICKGEAPNHSILIKSECETSGFTLSNPK